MKINLGFKLKQFQNKYKYSVIFTADKIAYVRDSSKQIIKFANYTDADESLTFPTGDWGSVASSLSTDAFGQLLDKEYDMNTSIKYRLATEDMGSDSSI